MVRTDSCFKASGKAVVTLALGIGMPFKLIIKENLASLTAESRCAAMNGIDSGVIERAEELCLLSTRGEDLVAACARISPRESEELLYAVCAVKLWSSEHADI